jgi:hypothetical protein
MSVPSYLSENAAPTRALLDVLAALVRASFVYLVNLEAPELI